MTIKNRAELTVEIHKLHEAASLMDALSHDSLSEIAAIAKLILRHLQAPEGQRDLDSIFHAIAAIYSKADDAKDQIAGLAGDAGCNHETESDLDDASEVMSDYDTHAATADALMHSAYLIDREVEATFDPDKLEALAEKRSKLQEAACIVEKLLDAEDGGSFNAAAWEPATLRNFFANV